MYMYYIPNLIAVCLAKAHFYNPFCDNPDLLHSIDITQALEPGSQAGVKGDLSLRIAPQPVVSPVARFPGGGSAGTRSGSRGASFSPVVLARGLLRNGLSGGALEGQGTGSVVGSGAVYGGLEVREGFRRFIFSVLHAGGEGFKVLCCVFALL